MVMVMMAMMMMGSCKKASENIQFLTLLLLAFVATELVSSFAFGAHPTRRTQRTPFRQATATASATSGTTTRSRYSSPIFLSHGNDDATSFISPWYSSPVIDRNGSHVLPLHRGGNGTAAMVPNLSLEPTRFVLRTKNGMLHQPLPQHGVGPYYLSSDEVNELLATNDDDSVSSLEELAASSGGPGGTILGWVGKCNGSDYWVVQTEHIEEEQLISFGNARGSGATVLPLREFGDRLEDSTDAGILATANGLAEFHLSHRFCSGCGAPTRSAKAGACRRCRDCGQSAYPRIDAATLMLVTSPCDGYALLGRKRQWPPGRYSTLAGFTEVGETLEGCVVREVREESGVRVDPATVRFVASQPWPFPRSLMVGFRARALGGSDGDYENVMGERRLPTIRVDVEEMEDVQWFAKDFVRERLEGGSTALTYVPSDSEAEFHIPGKAALARIMISRWAES